MISETKNIISKYKSFMMKHLRADRQTKDANLVMNGTHFVYSRLK